MDSELEVIRDQMQQTRASLSDKLEALEGQVRDTVQNATEVVNSTVSEVKQVVSSVTESVQSAKDAVSETVQNVAGTVSDTVESTVETVKQTFNVAGHVENYPWAAVGCAFAAGFAGGFLLGPSSSSGKKAEQMPSYMAASSSAPPAHQPAAPAASAVPAPPSSSGPSMLDKVGEALSSVTGPLQGLAVGSLFGVFRELVRSALPEAIHGDINGMIDQLSSSLGGKPAKHFDGLFDSDKGEGQSQAQGASPQQRGNR